MTFRDPTEPRWSLLCLSSATSLAAAAGAVPSARVSPPAAAAPWYGPRGRGACRERAGPARGGAAVIPRRAPAAPGTSRPDMALNKSMHARNRYKDKPPDFAYLAGKYPEFQQHVQTTLAGRVRYGRSGWGGRVPPVCPPGVSGPGHP